MSEVPLCMGLCSQTPAPRACRVPTLVISLSLSHTHTHLLLTLTHSLSLTHTPSLPLSRIQRTLSRAAFVELNGISMSFSLFLDAEKGKQGKTLPGRREGKIG